MRERAMSRRQFTGLSAAALGLGALPTAVAAQAGAARAPAAAPAAVPRPDALKFQFLMDLVLETAPAVALGNRTVVSVTGGTFEGPKLKGRVLSPGADWPIAVNPNMRVLDVRTLLETDDAQRIYVSYRGVIYTPPGGQGERYWRSTPIFETNSEKYAWLNHIVAVGVNFTVPQRVAYRIFEIL
jgi:hypothetical protein